MDEGPGRRRGGLLFRSGGLRIQILSTAANRKCHINTEICQSCTTFDSGFLASIGQLWTEGLNDVEGP